MSLSLAAICLTDDFAYASVDNPLIYRDSEDLKRDVNAFYTRYELDKVVDKGLLVRGARLAQDDVLFASSGDLSPIENRALEREKTPRLKDQSRELNTILLTCCIGAITHGWSR